MEYKLEIYQKPLEAISSGQKKVEIRTNNSYESIAYDTLSPGDIINFQMIAGPPFIGLDVIKPDALKVKVLNIRHYAEPRSLLISEGLEVLSTLVENLDNGVELLYSFHEYKKMIPMHGLFAIEIEPMS
ncbi:hypothetical protein N9R79_03040 [Vibrio sp.]|nr:hypothetical protein [Vibrio sp.]